MTGNCKSNDKPEKPDKIPLSSLDKIVLAFAIIIMPFVFWGSWIFAPSLLGILNKLHITAIFAQSPFHIFFELKAINMDDPIYILWLELMSEFCKRILIFISFLLLGIQVLKYSLIVIRKVLKVFLLLILNYS